MDWRTIPSAPNYEASESGEIRNQKTGTVLKPQDDGRAGYLKVGVRGKNGAAGNRYVHHLVAEAFFGLRPAGSDIDHKDGCRTNNAVANLRYCTRRENQDNPNNHGMNGWQRRASRGVVAMKDGVETVFSNMVDAARTLGVCLSGISNVLSGKLVNKGYRNGAVRYCSITTCGGYSFRWAED